jgi:hypothetical protein
MPGRLVPPPQLPFFFDELDLQLDPAHALSKALKAAQHAKWTDALGPTQRQIFLGCSAEVQARIMRNSFLHVYSFRAVAP